MKRQDYLLCLAFFLIGIFSRYPLIEKMQSHMDGPMYSIALVNYSFEQENPTAPGYPLYIGVAKVFLPLTNDPHQALLLVSVLFSGIGAVIFFLFGKSIFNRTCGIIAACFFLSSPAIYYFGITAYAYIVVLVMTTAITWCVYEIAFKGKKMALLLGVLYAVSLGVRPQEVILTFPLFLFGIASLPNKERLKTVLAFVFSFLLWFIPFILLTGGLQHFLIASSLAAKTALPNPALTYFFRKIFELSSGFYLTIGTGIVLFAALAVKVCLKILRKPTLSKWQKKFFIYSLAWFIPPFFFNIFVRTEHAGYQFDYLAYVIILLSLFLAKELTKHRYLLLLLTLLLVFGNLILFFYNRDPKRLRPYRQSSLHYTDLRRNDAELASKISYIKENFLPIDTIIFSSTPFWKQYMYHLPNYNVYSVDGLFSSDKRYSYLVRSGYKWERRLYFLQSNKLEISKNIRHLVLLDNDSCQWAPKNAKRIHFSKNACFVVVSLVKVGGVTFDYHKILFSS